MSTSGLSFGSWSSRARSARLSSLPFQTSIEPGCEQTSLAVCANAAAGSSRTSRRKPWSQKIRSPGESALGSDSGKATAPANLQFPQRSPTFPSSAAVQHGVDLPCIGLVVHDAPFDFDPGVRPERHVLGADDQFRRHTEPSQQADGRRRTLQAQNLFPVPDRGEVDGRTDGAGNVFLPSLPVSESRPSDGLIECGEVASREVELEAKQQ